MLGIWIYSFIEGLVVDRFACSEEARRRRLVRADGEEVEIASVDNFCKKFICKEMEKVGKELS